MTTLLLIVGLGLILAGASLLTDGASAVAKKFGISEFVIGLTIVGIGTSMPEMVVSLLSAAAGKSDIAIGNVVGSNLFNALFILGVTAVILPLPLTAGNVRKDIPFGILASAVLLIAVSDTLLDGAAADSISRSEGVLMLCFFAVFMAYTVFSAKGQHHEEKKDSGKKPMKMWLAAVMILSGLGALIFGGQLFLDNAVEIARRLGVSESVIAVTLVAGGTSLPELATSIVAALKRNEGIALGNVIGSNIANIFLVLGASATVSPLTLGDILPADVLAMLVSSVLLFVAAFTMKKRRIDRAEGLVFILLYVAYVYWLIVR